MPNPIKKLSSKKIHIQKQDEDSFVEDNYHHIALEQVEYSSDWTLEAEELNPEEKCNKEYLSKIPIMKHCEQRRFVYEVQIVKDDRIKNDYDSLEDLLADID